MKKRTFKIAVSAVVVAVAGYNVYANLVNKDGMSELELANAEALAAGEEGKVDCLNMFDPCIPGVYGPYISRCS